MSQTKDSTGRAAPDSITPIPTKWIGPIRISAAGEQTDVDVPLATYESPLWPSCNRGADVSRMSPGGIRVSVADERMSRSVLFVSDDAVAALAASEEIIDRRPELERVVAGQSRFARLLGIHPEVVGNLLFVRFEYATGDASGHNMATQASEAVMDAVLGWGLPIRYGSISGNYCIDKKASAVNGILGRGKRVVADIFIPDEVIAKRLHTTAEAIAELNYRKNWVGSTLAGSLRSANAHFANMLLAVYLATGQDAANIVEGSQGFTHAEQREGGLYFSVTLPNLIVGTVGNGKDLPEIEQTMRRMGFEPEAQPGVNSRKLAGIIAAVVLCGELSLLAAQTRPGELMNAHRRFERHGAAKPAGASNVAKPADASGLAEQAPASGVAPQSPDAPNAG